MGLTKGYKYKKLSDAQKMQRKAAWVGHLESREEGPAKCKLKRGQVRTKITDGRKHMKDVTNLKLNMPEGLTEEQQQELFDIGKNALLDITQNPLLAVGKEAAQLKMDLARQQMLDNKEGDVFSKDKERILKLYIKIAEISQKAELAAKKSGKKTLDLKEADVIIDEKMFG